MAAAAAVAGCRSSGVGCGNSSASSAETLAAAGCRLQQLVPTKSLFFVMEAVPV